MPNKPAEIIVRCEDLQQHVFIYRCLVKNGIHPRTIQIRHNPGGDAKRFVLDQYPVQVKALRRTPHVSKAVISMMDADDCTVEERKREHDNALNESGQDHRVKADKIAILVPRRNIETWVHHLLGKMVNEHDAYPRFRYEERKCAPAAQEFARRCPNDMREADLPSLHDGCAELQRIMV
ncbi:MAG: hypothetical protein KJ749_15435 [Planctomycetes bacterium]|nr:hypothetical protein [Planctomycetota bacterium]